jgi:hypothetical protein
MADPVSAPERNSAGGPAADRCEAARDRLGRAQAALLAALVADAPAPEGFDEERLAVQRRALVGKRAGVVAKIAPELPEILGETAFRTAFAGYARGRPMTGGYRRDALRFARYLLTEQRAGAELSGGERRRLRRWWLERSGPVRPPDGRIARELHLLRVAWRTRRPAVPRGDVP